MEFLKSVLVGIALVFLLFILLLSGSQGADLGGGLAAVFLLIVMTPLILFMSIIIGIGRQRNKPKVGPNNEMKIGKGIYFLILIILILFFFKVILPNLKHP